MATETLETLNRMAFYPSDDTVLRLALAPRLTPALAQCLSGRRDAQSLLAWLAGEGLSVRDEDLYTWVPGVRGKLRARAEEVFTPEYLQGLDTLGATLLEEQGWIGEAAHVYFETRRWNMGMAVLARHVGEDPGGSSGWQTVLALVPTHVRASMPGFWYLRGMMEPPGHLWRALRAFVRGQRLASEHESLDAAALGCFGQSLVASAMLLKRPGDAVRRRWLDLGRVRRSGGERDVANLTLLYGAWFWPVQPYPLLRRLVELEHAALSMPSPLLRAQAAIAVLFGLSTAGALGRAHTFRQRMDAHITQEKLPAPVYAWWLLACAFHSLASGELDGLAVLVERIESLLARTGRTDGPCVTLLRSVLVLAAVGPKYGMQPSLAGPTRSGSARSVLDAMVRVWWILRGEGRSEALSPACERMLEASRYGAIHVVDLYVQLTYVIALCVSGELTAAQQVLGKVSAGARHGTLVQYQLLLHEAMVALIQGDRAKLRTLLENAFRLARRHVLLGVPLHWPREWFSQLCLVALEAHIETDFVTSLVNRHQLPAPQAKANRAWPWAVQVRTLGAFQLCLEGVPAETSGKAQRRPLELLKVIIAYGGRAIDSQIIAAALWPDADSNSAQSSFDITLHRLRKLLGRDESIQVFDRKVSLNRQLVWFDTSEFVLQVTAGLETLQLMGTGELMATADRVMDLYRGDFLQLEEAQPWAVMARDRLRSQWLRLISSIAQVLVRENETESAIALFKRCIESDPLAEDVYRQLMQCYQKERRYAEAVAIYRRCRDMFSIVLGIPPSERTTTIYLECLGK